MICVTGAGGFCGGHLVAALVADGYEVRAVDIKPLDQWYQHSDAIEICADVSSPTMCELVVDGADQVYNLAADMGGMGFIEGNRALCMLSVLINTNMLVAARSAGVERYFYSSSACVYPDYRQATTDGRALVEDDAYPAAPEDGYGWEKLFSERMCRHFSEDFGLLTRVARYHNVYGPHGTWTGGREKAPAAVCRKVAMACITGNYEIEIWGDGDQTRSFTYIDDCVAGTRLLMGSNVDDPLNVGSSELVSINGLVSIVEDIVGVKLARSYLRSAPQGVRGRNSDNTKILELLAWEPTTTLRQGLEQTYLWVLGQIEEKQWLKNGR